VNFLRVPRHRVQYFVHTLRSSRTLKLTYCTLLRLQTAEIIRHILLLTAYHVINPKINVRIQFPSTNVNFLPHTTALFISISIRKQGVSSNKQTGSSRRNCRVSLFPGTPRNWKPPMNTPSPDSKAR